MDTDLHKWEGIVDSIAIKGLAREVFMIPAGQAMAALYDQIEKNNVKGYNDISDFFFDDIHLNDLGKYYISCVFFATIYHENPINAKSELYSMYGGKYNIPNDSELIVQLQQMAYDVVCKYNRDGFDCVISSLTDQTNMKSKPFPNPTDHTIWFSGKGSLLNTFGNVIATGVDQIDLSTVKSGIYFLKTDKYISKIIKL